MKWLICHGNILDVKADALICSANVQLNMSGGVGGEILVRFGDPMQKELHHYLSERGISFVAPGTVVKTSPCGTPFSMVLHAVAIDVFYETSHELIVSTIRRALEICSENEIKTVTLTALATGYGRYPLNQFALVLLELQKEKFPALKEITVCLRNENDANELVEYLDNFSSNPPMANQ